MISPRELITICRQMGGMMEADVDILRITRVLRSQTENPRLLELFDEIDHELTMGRSLSDALARAGDIFSPFAVSLVRQGEERNATGSALLRLAEFLQKEQESDATPQQTSSSSRTITHGTTSAAPQEWSFDATPFVPHNFARETLFKVLWSQLLYGAAAICGVLSAVTAITALEILPARWQTPLALLCCACVLAIGAKQWQKLMMQPQTAQHQQVPIPLNEEEMTPQSTWASPELPTKTFEASQNEFPTGSATDAETFENEPHDAEPLERWQHRVRTRSERGHAAQEEEFD